MNGYHPSKRTAHRYIHTVSEFDIRSCAPVVSCSESAPSRARGKSVVAVLPANEFQFRHDADLLIWMIMHLSRGKLGGASTFGWSTVIEQGSAHSTTLRRWRNSPNELREVPVFHCCHKRPSSSSGTISVYCRTLRKYAVQ